MWSAAGSPTWLTALHGHRSRPGEFRSGRLRRRQWGGVIHSPTLALCRTSNGLRARMDGKWDMSKAARYRALADHFSAMSRKAVSEGDRKALIHLAQSYRALADNEDW